MKLSDSQTVLLKAASVHPKRLLTDFPPKLKGGALIKVLTSLGNAGFIAPHNKPTDGTTRFCITSAGLEATCSALARASSLTSGGGNA